MCVGISGFCDNSACSRRNHSILHSHQQYGEFPSLHMPMIVIFWSFCWFRFCHSCDSQPDWIEKCPKVKPTSGFICEGVSRGRTSRTVPEDERPTLKVGSNIPQAGVPGRIEEGDSRRVRLCSWSGRTGTCRCRLRAIVLSLSGHRPAPAALGGAPGPAAPTDCILVAFLPPVGRSSYKDLCLLSYGPGPFKSS